MEARSQLADRIRVTERALMVRRMRKKETFTTSVWWKIWKEASVLCCLGVSGSTHCRPPDDDDDDDGSDYGEKKGTMRRKVQSHLWKR